MIKQTLLIIFVLQIISGVAKAEEPCGDGSTADSDGDLTYDCHDACPTDPNKTATGLCGCGNLDYDSDGDGYSDTCDAEACASTYPRSQSARMVAEPETCPIAEICDDVDNQLGLRATQYNNEPFKDPLAIYPNGSSNLCPFGTVCGINSTLPEYQDCVGSGICVCSGVTNGLTTVCKEATIDNDACRGCGNGIVEVFEECDDGNRTNGDGCDQDCDVESAIGSAGSCGDGFVDSSSGEECDDGNALDGDGCSGLCKNEICGDAIVQITLGEECDDGNALDDDGCSGKCKNETEVEVFCADGITKPEEFLCVSNLGATSPGEKSVICYDKFFNEQFTAIDFAKTQTIATDDLSRLILLSLDHAYFVDGITHAVTSYEIGGTTEISSLASMGEAQPVLVLDGPTGKVFQVYSADGGATITVSLFAETASYAHWVVWDAAHSQALVGTDDGIYILDSTGNLIAQVDPTPVVSSFKSHGAWMFDFSLLISNYNETTGIGQLLVYDTNTSTLGVAVDDLPFEPGKVFVEDISLIIAGYDTDSVYAIADYHLLDPASMPYSWGSLGTIMEALPGLDQPMGVTTVGNFCPGTVTSGLCMPQTETCDGLDNDCDGLIDEEGCPSRPTVSIKPPTDCPSCNDCDSCNDGCGDVTATATAFVGDIIVNDGDITISYTGGSTTTSDGTISGDIEPAPVDELGIAAAEGVPEGDSVLLGSSCSFNSRGYTANSFQVFLWIVLLLGIPSCYIPFRVYRCYHRSILKLYFG